MKTCSTCKTLQPVSNFHKDKTRSDGRTYRCKQCCAAKSKKVRENNLHPVTAMRLAAVQLLGGQCTSCGFTDIRALQIDHIAGGGLQEIRAIGSYNIYKKIANGNTDGYQVLCANCNWIKRYDNSEIQCVIINNRSNVYRESSHGEGHLGGKSI